MSNDEIMQGLENIDNPVMFTNGNFWADTGSSVIYYTTPVEINTSYDTGAVPDGKNVVKAYSDSGGATYSPGVALRTLDPVSTFGTASAGNSPLRRSFGLMDWGEWQIFWNGVDSTGTAVALVEGMQLSPAINGVIARLDSGQAIFGISKDKMDSGESGFIRYFLDPKRVL